MSAAARFAAAFAVALCLAPRASAADPPIAIAVADFDYSDTSGEAADQRPQHRARLDHFAAALLADMTRSGRYRAVALRCPASGCAVGVDPVSLIGQARAAGAAMVVFGGVHKLSTLVQWARIDVLATATGRPLYSRLLTFRNDTDESWRRAEQFAADELLTAAPHP